MRERWSSRGSPLAPAANASVSAMVCKKDGICKLRIYIVLGRDSPGLATYIRAVLGFGVDGALAEG